MGNWTRDPPDMEPVTKRTGKHSSSVSHTISSSGLSSSHLWAFAHVFSTYDTCPSMTTAIACLVFPRQPQFILIVAT